MSIFGFYGTFSTFSWYHFTTLFCQKMRGKARKENAALKDTEMEKKTNAWPDMSQAIDSATKIEKLNVVVVIITPLIMLAFNIVYFFLTT